MAGLRAVGAALGCALTLLAGGGMSSASAQQAYALKELPTPPFPVASGRFEPTDLADNGDVVGLAAWTTGTVWAFDIKRFRFYQTTKDTFQIPVWPAAGGAARFLPMPAGGTLTSWKTQGIDGTGRVVAGLSGGFTGYAVIRWAGTQRTTLTPALSRFPEWSLSRVNGAGKIAAFTNSPAPRIAIVSDRSVVQALPLPPEPGLSDGTAQFAQTIEPLALNNQDDVVVHTFGSGALKAWLWSGGVWTDVTPPPPAGFSASDVEELTFHSLNNRGEVLLGAWVDVIAPDGSHDKRHFKWVVSRQSGATQLPDKVGGFSRSLVLADNGDVLGILPGGAGGASIWRNGQLIGINTLTQAPAGYAIFDVVDANAKGQLLVSMNSPAPDAPIRYGVMTPK